MRVILGCGCGECEDAAEPRRSKLVERRSQPSLLPTGLTARASLAVPGMTPPAAGPGWSTTGDWEAGVLIFSQPRASGVHPRCRVPTQAEAAYPRLRSLVDHRIPAAAPGRATTTVTRPTSSGSRRADDHRIDNRGTVERFYLGLVNCTRTGGWVVSDGTCRRLRQVAINSAYVAPIAYSYGMSDLFPGLCPAPRPARLCSHTADGDPATACVEPASRAGTGARHRLP